MVTTTPTRSSPFFLFQGTGNFLSDEANASGTLTFTVNGGATQSFSRFGTGESLGTVTPTDAVACGGFPGVTLGSVVVLNAGSITTNNTFAGAPPANGAYQMFLYDNGSGARLNAAGGTTVPEPSTWALLLAGAGLTGLMVRRRARLA